MEGQVSRGCSANVLSRASLERCYQWREASTAGGWATRLPHVRWSTSLLVGGLLVGWSSFNVVEGIVDHYLLGLHHVKEGSNNLLAWDLGFLAWGAIMLVGGLALMRKGDRETGREPAAATR